MATQDTQKFPGPFPTTANNITPPSRETDDSFIGEQWREADKSGMGEKHPNSINRDTSYA